jgi:hypothetical protein
LHEELAARGTNVSAEMYPGGASFRHRALPAWPGRNEVVETEMAEFVTTIGDEDHIAAGRGAQGFEPANKTSAPLGSHCHHELRGVITTTGGEERREPRIAMTTFERPPEYIGFPRRRARTRSVRHRRGWLQSLRSTMDRGRTVQLSESFRV